MAGGIQTQVGVIQAPAVAGDWASGNPRSFYTGGPGGLVAGPSGVTVGQFAWAQWIGAADADAAPTVVANSFNGFPFGSVGGGGANAPTGFIHRQQQGLNTTYLLDASMTVPQGFSIALCTAGDVWVVNSGSGYAQVGMTAFADYLTGKISFAAGSTASTVTCATTAIAAATALSATGGIAGNLMTLSAVASGTAYNGMTVTGTGVTTGTMIVSQVLPLLAGETTGGVGRYYVSIGEQSVAAGTAIAATGGIITLGATPSGAFRVGALLSGTNVVAGTYITQLITGTGLVNGNTLAVNNATVVASTTISATTNVATKWFAQSGGSTGEYVKMSSWALG